ncbi:hypothetical protein VMCG_09369 [Cytospora schulzeri]|uniref:ZN622/Rei1/Reh1 zinc finger C2H2-type domain-containing protein n=1 Tax=Cytospora schulzeri TaxID=448051 RepID=A0A423VJQ0_9PEZI|nr:hypothetical protein VMCG_09369 [Valsa malicola]
MTTNVNTLGASGTTATAKGKSVASSISFNRSEIPSEFGDTNVNEPGTMNVEADTDIPELTFTPEQCLFCNLTSPDLDSSMAHMQKNHGLFIPVDIEDGLLRLAVDLETLVRYLHLVIFGYNECLYCHSQKQTTQAVQQHMMGKGHCRVDLDGEDSEFKDFYEEVEDGSAPSEAGLDETEPSRRSDEEETIGETSGDQTSRRQPSSKIGGNSLSLQSGKVISHRSAPPPRHHRPLAETQDLTRRGADHRLPTTLSASDDIHTAPESADDDVPATDTTESNRVLTRFERRAETNNRSTLSLAISKLSVNDRAALAHLPAAEQRAIVLTQFKQQDKARHQERRYRGKMDRKNNSLLMKHFVSDVPGPKLG